MILSILCHKTRRTSLKYFPNNKKEIFKIFCFMCLLSYKENFILLPLRHASESLKSRSLDVWNSSSSFASEALCSGKLIVPEFRSVVLHFNRTTLNDLKKWRFSIIRQTSSKHPPAETFHFCRRWKGNFFYLLPSHINNPPVGNRRWSGNNNCTHSNPIFA